MSKYIIQGGNKLSGEIEVQGAKNLALKIIPAALLSDEEIEITNVPEIEDVKRMLEILEFLNVKVEHTESGVKINPKDMLCKKLDNTLVRRIRASVMLIAPLLARCGEVFLPHPGGCVLGKRPIDLFIDGFKSFGVEITEMEDGYHFQVEQLKGANFFFPIISVTATESMMMAGVLAKGKTRLENCACEPEISALAEYLNQCGARIKGAGTNTIEIEGVDKISAGKFDIIPDRIEAASFVILGACANSDLKITKCNPNHMKSLWALFDRMGVRYELGDDYVQMFPSNHDLKPVNIKTHEYPGFVTDMQAPMVVLLTRAKGISHVHETIFNGRLFYTEMLNQMGANINLCDPHRAIVIGKTDLIGKKVMSPDLRAGIAMVIAGLIADGETQIDNIYQVERGYANLIEKLRGIGADITKQE